MCRQRTSVFSVTCLFQSLRCERMELLVKSRQSSIVFKNAFQNMNELCLARTQWNARVGIEKCVRQFVSQRKSQKLYFGVTASKSNLSIVQVNDHGTLLPVAVNCRGIRRFAATVRAQRQDEGVRLRERC